MFKNISITTDDAKACSISPNAIIKVADGLYAVFPTASSGIAAAIEAQLKFENEPWEETGPLHVRIGLHSGEAQQRTNDYFGPVVNRAARIMGAAWGEQILISQTTAELAEQEMPAGVNLSDLGEHYLRGLAQPVRLYQVHHPDLPGDFPPLKTLGVIPNNLPAQISSFIGREEEIDEVRHLLAPDHDANRMVTLTGPGGTGKTRLSLQVAGELLEQFPHGVWFVELAPVAKAIGVGETSGVLQAVAMPMGVREQATRPLEPMLIDYLRSKKALLILDNCEHVIDECAQLADELLRSCPELHILASSREALGITGERPYQLHPLSLPAGKDELDVESLLHYEAVQLFVERAEAVSRDFQLTANNARDVVRICRRLDGIPLAIELAAARVRVLSTAQIEAHLDDRFHLLSGGSRAALPRQRTLRALIDWSHDLLSDAERILFRRLAVFKGGWALEAAEDVAGIEPLKTYEVLDLLDQLANKSLIVPERTELGMRYSMLESILNYAQEKLTDSGEYDLAAGRHLAHFLRQSREAFEDMMDLRPPGDAMARFKPDVDNFRAAWARSLRENTQAALDFTAYLSQEWTQIVPSMELHRFQQRALVQATESPAYSTASGPNENRRLLGDAYLGAVTIASTARLLVQTIDYASKAATVAEETGDTVTRDWAETLLRFSNMLRGNFEGIARWHNEEYGFLIHNSPPMRKAFYLTYWGMINLVLTGDYPPLAQTRWEEGMAMLRRSGNLWLQAAALQTLADLQSLRGETDEAQLLAEEVLEIYTELGDTYAANPSRSLLADVARRRGDLTLAAGLYRDTIRVWRDSGRADASARTLESLAFVSFAQTLEMAVEDRPARLAYAATLLGAAAGIRERIQRPQSPIDVEGYERGMAALREEAGVALFQRAWEKGEAMDLDEAVLLATEENML